MKPTTGSAIVAQPADTSSSATRGWIVWPDRPVNGWCPTTSRLETMVDAASRTRVSSANAIATTDLAQNSRDRLIERVSTVFQVPCWSSLAKMSPATIAASSGSTHWEAKPSTRRAIANPFSVANRPNSVSFGGRGWECTTTTTASGATRAPTSSALVRTWARSLRDSQRTADAKPGRTDRSALRVTSWVITALGVVGVIGVHLPSVGG